MATTTGFGLGDNPFTSSGYSSFTDLSRSVAASVNVPSSSSGGGAVTTGNGGFFNNVLGAIGNGLSRVADFVPQIFIWDELAERGQVPSSNTNQTTTTSTQQTATGTSTSLIKGISNETLMIGGVLLLVVVVLLSRLAK